MTRKSANGLDRPLSLTDRNRDVLVQALLAPPPPSLRLILALERYRATQASSERIAPG